jgi:branched-chain amino acid transport system substrate-binding protein
MARTEAAFAADSQIKIVAAVSLTDPGAYYGVRTLDGARLAVEEANASADGPQIDLVAQDDESSQASARRLGEQACKTDAAVVVGPVLTTVALAADPVYANCGLVTVPATAHGDDVPKSPTTFQPVFNGGEMGSALAVYLKEVLHGEKAVVLYRADGYGQPFANGFASAAKALGLVVATRGFSTEAERDAAAKETAEDPDRPAIALGMLVGDAVPILTTLRRKGLHSPVLAPSALAGDEFVTQFAAEPEEKNRRGFFTDGIYAASPIMFDSANADTLDFADRFRRRYGREPSWPAVQGYDAAHLAITAA